MKFHRTLMPGQPGTKKLQQQYGERLFCVRYRYDPSKHECIKTIELVIERKNWIPDPQRIPPNKIMSLKIKYGEVELGRQVKSVGGRWDAKTKLWRLPYRKIAMFGLVDRIVTDEEVSHKRNMPPKWPQ